MVRLRFGPALLLLALLTGITALHPHSVGAHGCAPPIPPPVPGPLIPAPSTYNVIYINEVLSNASSAWNCSDNGSKPSYLDDWVELYNPRNQSFDLYATHASFDNGPNSQYVFYFPLGAAIAAHSFLVLFPNGHSNLLFPGATLRLLINGIPIDQLSIPTLGPDQSFARIPDGSNTWQTISTPTIDASNAPPQPTPTPTSSSSNGSGSGGGYGKGSGYRSKTPTIINGTQTAWGKLQLPTAAPASTSIVDAPSTISTSSPPLNNPSDLPRRILLTILVVALALALFWCWHLFRSP